MCAERLSGLALTMNVANCKILIEDELIKLFANANPRRMKLSFVLDD